MPAIPASTKSSVALRLLAHAEQNWPQLKRVEVAYRGVFAYITGVLGDGEQIPLCRLRYGGSAHSFGFAIYSAASDRYREAALLTGLAPVVPKRRWTLPAPFTSQASAGDQSGHTARRLINPRGTSSAPATNCACRSRAPEPFPGVQVHGRVDEQAELYGQPPKRFQWPRASR